MCNVVLIVYFGNQQVLHNFFFLSFFLSLQSALIMSPYNTFAFQWVQLVLISTSNSPGYNSFRYLLYFLYSFAFKFPYQSAANYFTFAWNWVNLSYIPIMNKYGGFVSQTNFQLKKNWKEYLTSIQDHTGYQVKRL